MEQSKSLPYIMLLGRPGCGKSLIYKILCEQFQKKNIAHVFERIDDFPILKSLLDQDIEFKRHERKDGGFAVTDWTIIDEVLQVINNTISEKESHDKSLFIEFSRSNYQEALKNFNSNFLDHCVILYIKTSFAICLKRNEERFKKAKEENLDDHIVPPDLMKTYYKEDDFEKILDQEGEEQLKKLISSPIYVLDNNIQNIDILQDNLIKFITFYQSLL